MRYKATKKFKESGIENSYHQLNTEDYFKLKAGAAVELKLDKNNQYLIDNKYLEKVPETYKKVKGE